MKTIKQKAWTSACFFVSSIVAFACIVRGDWLLSLYWTLYATGTYLLFNRDYRVWKDEHKKK